MWAFYVQKSISLNNKYMDHARCVREQENAPFVTIDGMKWALLQVLQPIINKATLPVGIKFLGNWMLQIVLVLWHLIYSIRYRNDYAIVRFDNRIKKTMPVELSSLSIFHFFFFCVSVSGCRHDLEIMWQAFLCISWTLTHFPCLMHVNSAVCLGVCSFNATSSVYQTSC